MSRVFSNISSGPKTWSVDDESIENQYIPSGQNAPKQNIPREQPIDYSAVQNMRNQARQASQRNEYEEMQNARRKIDIIIGIGRRTKDVEINNENGSKNTITLRTLKTYEKRMLSQTIQNADRGQLPDGSMYFTPVGMTDIKREAIVHSLYAIDNQPIDIVLGCYQESPDVQLEAKRELAESMDDILISYLYSKYEELRKETEDGYNPQNENEVKEVVDTIRKSS